MALAFGSWAGSSSGNILFDTTAAAEGRDACDPLSIVESWSFVNLDNFVVKFARENALCC